jgi:hypothetical protein
MAFENFTDEDSRAVLLAVGADPSLSPCDYTRSFEELGLDSLAWMEIASRIQDRFGVDIDGEFDAGRTPAEMKALVNELLPTIHA